MSDDDECCVVFTNVEKSHSSVIQINKERTRKAKLDKLMKAAEENKANVVKQMLRDNHSDLSVDDKDQFGWTALMCACCAGANDVVAALLGLKAKVHIRNNCGQTCTTLARARGHNSTLQILSGYASDNSNYMHRKVQEEPVEHNLVTVLTSTDSESEDVFFCDLCKESFPQETQPKHLSSTVHMFNMGLKPHTSVDAPVKYDIAESNKGYQIMLKSGWNTNKGLGVNEDGTKYPLKAIVKRDRCGLGVKKYRRHINHSSARVVPSKKPKPNDGVFEMENPNRSLQHLRAIEEQAEDILRDRTEIVALDRRRNSNRMALKALSKQQDKKTWFALGSMLLKLPSESATRLLQKDQVATDTEINKIRSDLKVKVNELRDLEHQSPVPGLNLKPLTRQEVAAVSQALGQHA